ncbi:MAG: pyrroline-5-carboxylate reductase [Eubacteriales bacterium]|nr:pyrroline-5-carboxylate reductase [Eubacteriales bacterium]
MKYGFIGVGNMGKALASCVRKNVKKEDLLISELNIQKTKEISLELDCTSSNNKEIVQKCDLIFIGVKPQNIKELLNQLSEDLINRKKNNNRFILCSMAAGVSIKKINEYINDTCPTIRIMPNLAVSVGQGMILVSKNEDVFDDEIINFCKILDKAGELDIVEEEMIDKAQAVTGCAPAYVSIFIESMCDGLVHCGVRRDKALQYTLQTILGTANYIKETNTHPAILKDRVCSPQGTTIEGVVTLEDGAFRSSVINAIINSYNKNKNM